MAKKGFLGRLRDLVSNVGKSIREFVSGEEPPQPKPKPTPPQPPPPPPPQPPPDDDDIEDMEPEDYEDLTKTGGDIRLNRYNTDDLDKLEYRKPHVDLSGAIEYAKTIPVPTEIFIDQNNLYRVRLKYGDTRELIRIRKRRQRRRRPDRKRNRRK